MAFKNSERKPDTFKIQNRWRFTQNSTLNLQLYKNIHQKKTNHNIALIRENQRRKKIKGNKEFDNLTSSNISKIAKRKNIISRKHHIIINDTSTSQMSKCFQRKKVKYHNKCSTNKAPIT